MSVKLPRVHQQWPQLDTVDLFPDLDIEIESVEIKSKSSRIKSSWSIEHIEDNTEFYAFFEKRKSMDVSYEIKKPVLLMVERDVLVKHFEARAKEYRDKMEKTMARLQTMESVKKEEEVDMDEEMRREVLSYSNQMARPIDSMRGNLRSYKARAKWFTVAAKHLALGPFTLTMDDISTLELDQ